MAIDLKVIGRYILLRDAWMINIDTNYGSTGGPSKWEHWYAWHPVKLNGEWKWCEHLARRARLETFLNRKDQMCAVSAYEYRLWRDVVKDIMEGLDPDKRVITSYGDISPAVTGYYIRRWTNGHLEDDN